MNAPSRSGIPKFLFEPKRAEASPSPTGAVRRGKEPVLGRRITDTP